MNATPWYVVGLGNPGAAYAHTRHNIGRDVVSAFARHIGAGAWRPQARGAVCITEGQLDGMPVICITPEQAMNHSGRALQRYGLSGTDASQLIVVHDDCAIPFGQVRVSTDRGAGGHNGVADIQDALQTKAFVRVRIGISPRGLLAGVRRPRGASTSRFVLSPFTPAERRHIDAVCDQANAAIGAIITDGVEAAMQQYNARG